VNAYTVEFFANCPNNGIRIKYRMRIEQSGGEVIPVEQIIAAVESESVGFHEEIADRMLERFGGVQMLVADHHGVTIETVRGAHPSHSDAALQTSPERAGKISPNAIATDAAAQKETKA
jgi:hypothetical protein